MSEKTNICIKISNNNVKKNEDKYQECNEWYEQHKQEKEEMN